MTRSSHSSWHFLQCKKLTRIRTLAAVIPPVVRQMVLSRVEGYEQLVNDLLPPPGGDSVTRKLTADMVEALFVEVSIINYALTEVN